MRSFISNVIKPKHPAPPPAESNDSHEVKPPLPPHPPASKTPKLSLLSALDEKTRRTIAIARIQSAARRKRALMAAEAHHQWKIFADLDTHDEAEMLHLAVFMQTLIETVPGADSKPEKSVLLQHLNEEEEASKDTESDPHRMVIRLGDLRYKEVHSKNHSLSKTSSRLREYDLCDIEMDHECVQEVVKIYSEGGRLSRNSVVKILRKVYKIMLKLPNVSRVNVPERGICTVVGDLHGQLSDLLHILETAGLPNAENRFVFNGDFVDRGDKGVEIVCILFLLVVVYGPEVVALNRGNHEDLPVCRVYGFESEVKEKYDELLFEMFAEVFNHLPLCTIINDTIFVVHGGLFHTPAVSIQDLQAIERTDYFVKPPVPYPQNTKGMNAEDARKEFLKQLQRDALWSDPTDEVGCFLNPRGAGVSFGPDVAREFMRNNNFAMVVRSHECVLRGCEMPYQLQQYAPSKADPEETEDHDPAIPFLVTLFSASNYIGGDNEAAIVQFANHPLHKSKAVGGGSHMHYIIKRFKTSQGSADKIQESNNMSLRELIMKKKSALASAFEAADVSSSGMLTRLEWAEIMQKVTSMRIRWLGIIQTLAPAEAVTNTHVYYRVFLSKFSIDHPLLASDKGDDAKAALDDMYGMRKQLETIFYFFDTNGDGVISREEFRAGCELLNSSLHPDCQLTNIERTLEVMDFDGSGTIDINEFFETFRILDAKDGKVDGVISLAQHGNIQHQPSANVSKMLST